MVSSVGFSQVTKSAISGFVKSSQGAPLPGSSVEVIHQPTGTKYYANADFDGSYSVPSIRPGGPYVVKATFVGYKPTVVDEINAPLGGNVTVNLFLNSETSTLKEVVINAIPNSGSLFSKGRTGASQQFSTRELTAIPITGARSITAITKYNANAGSGGSFGGQDSRLNNFTIDGSAFNNGFGLGGESQAGGRTGSSAISLDAIEQLQINIAPFDVRQSGFTGSGINAVTRSGTNQFEGSIYGAIRNNRKEFAGTKAGRVEIVPGKFDEQTVGIRFGAPIIKNKLFFFGNFEKIDNISPATTWTASNSLLRGAQVSLPTVGDLDLVSNSLARFGYITGPYENYDAAKKSTKFLTRLDWNINDNNKLTLRYIQHDSFSEELTSNSVAVGFGNRRTNQFSLAYKNSGYLIKDNTRSIVAELDTKISERWSNNLLVGYDYQNEDRDLLGGGLFPTIDIKNGTNNYIAAGLDPFTQGNRLDYSTLHITNNVSKNSGKNKLLFGINYERFISNNSFFPGSNGAFIFDSLADFTNAANGSFANGGAPFTTALPPTPSFPLGIPLALPSRFQFRYSALPGKAEPLQILKSNRVDLYGQDDIKVSDKFRLVLGLRASAIAFENTTIDNPVVAGYAFANGQKLSTGSMPETQFLFEPRVGFNLDVYGDSSTQVRGGSGIFSGKAPAVLLSNAIGNNGVLTGFIDVSGDALLAGPVPGGAPYGFTPRPEQYYTPANAATPTSYDLAFTAKNFKFPQAWKTTVAVDQKLPFGFVGTIEGIFSKNINESYYYNANLAAPVGTLNGSISGDTRPFYSGTDNGVRLNNNVSNAIVLDNTSKGYFYSTTIKLEYPYKKGLWGSLAYTRSDAYDIISAGSIAASSWTGARSVNGNNNLPLSISSNNTPNRIVGLIGYRLDYGKGNYSASTSINIGYIGEQTGAFSYTYGGDYNGDMVNGNDLLFIPKKASDLRFLPITQTVGGGSGTLTLFTVAEQEAAFDNFIDQDPYLSTRRGQYAQRNANVLPILHKLDLSVTQDFSIKIAGKKNTFQFRADILNFTNLLNRNWGVSQRATAPNILSVVRNQGATLANGFIPGVQLAQQVDEQGKVSLAKDTFIKNASVFDVWQAQFTLRYIFGK